MAEDSGFCDMKILLQSFKQSEGDEAQDVLRTIAEHLKNDIKMKEHFHEVNGVSVILNVAMSANFSVLNLIFDTLAAAAEDHDGNRMQLTHERTFILINKVLISIDSLGLMACFRPLVLLSYVCAENAHAQELANISGCVKEMEKLFLRFSQDILYSADGKDEKVVFTWNILCTAIAAVCGEPANQKNQDILRSVVREGANFINECIDKSRFTLKDASCVKNLLIMLPYVLHSNRANQDFFARSGGVHAIVNGLANLEKKKNLDCDFTEIYIKFVYLLSISLIENAQTSKLAGFLGVIPILVQLMKQLSKKDKGMVLLCLANLLSCPENEQIFQHLDVSTYLISEMENFGESSECWKLLDKICNYLTEKQKSSSDLDLFGSPSSSVIDEKNRHSVTRYMQNGQKKMEKYPKNQEFDLNSEKNTKSIVHQKKFSDSYYVDKDKSRNHNEYPQSLPSYYKRSHNIRNDDNLVDEKFMKQQYERKKHPYEHGEVCYRRCDESEPVMLNKFHKSYDKTRRSNSPSDFSKIDVYTSHDDGYFLKHENPRSRQFLQTKDSSSDLINRARRLYPRNKMSELEEIDVHQKRHYFTKRDNFARHDETGRDQLRVLGSTSLKDYFDADNDPRENYGRRAVKGNPGGDFRREDFRKDWQRVSTDRYVRDYYDTDSEERKESVMESVGRRSRIDKPRKDYQIPPGRFFRNYVDDQNRDLGRKWIGFARDGYNTDEDSKKLFQRKSLERCPPKEIFEEDDNDTQLQKESIRLPRGRGQTTDSEIEIRRGQGKGLIDTFMKDDKTLIKEPWKERSKGSKPLEALKRSKSVGRINEFDIQSLLKDMDLVRCSPNEKSSLLCSEDTRTSNSSEGNRAESPVMPMLLNVRDTQHKNTSPPQSPQKSILKTPSDLESSTQSVVNFKNEEEKSDTKYENHYSANDGTINQKDNDKLTETGGNEQATNSPAKTLFSEEEERYLVQGIEKFGLDFKTIYQEFKFHENRTPHDLYEKWKYSYNF